MDAIRGQKRSLPEQIEATINASIHNRFDIEVVDSRTGKIKQKVQAENIILNSLWNNMGAAWSGYIHYGEGTGTPAVTDAALFKEIASVAITTDGRFFISSDVVRLKGKIVIDEATSVGKTITEIGVGTSNTLCTHAMLKDMNGNQISITKTNTDIINIYATLFLHFKYDSKYILMSPFGAMFDSLLGRVTYYGLGLPNRAFLTYSSNQNGWENDSRIESFNFTWNGTSKKFESNTVRFKAEQGNNPNRMVMNLVGYNSSYSTYVSMFCFPVSAWYSGSDITAEAIGTGDGTTVDFKTKFSLVSNAQLLIDGVVQSDVTIDTNIPFPTYAASFFTPLIKIGENFVPVCVKAGGIQYNGLWCSNFISVGAESNKRMYYQNDYTDKIGILRITGYNGSSLSQVSMSNDLVTWTAITIGSDIPENLRFFKYLKIDYNTYDNYDSCALITLTKTTDSNIHFTTPPAQGSVITANYHTGTIAKDTDHVFDFSCSIQLGEHTT